RPEPSGDVELVAGDEIEITNAWISLHLLHPRLAHHAEISLRRKRFGGERLLRAPEHDVLPGLELRRLNREARRTSYENQGANLRRMRQGVFHRNSTTHRASNQHARPRAPGTQ